jgi:hypothetical protein
MKWFNKFKKKSSPYLDKGDVIEGERRLSFHDSSNGMTINFVKATGGYILELRHHENNDGQIQLAIGPSIRRQSSELYIIKDGEDLGNEIGKIITLSMLKR